MVFCSFVNSALNQNFYALQAKEQSPFCLVTDSTERGESQGSISDVINYIFRGKKTFNGHFISQANLSRTKILAYRRYFSDLVDQLGYIVFTELAVLTITLIISN